MSFFNLALILQDVTKPCSWQELWFTYSMQLIDSMSLASILKRVFDMIEFAAFGHYEQGTLFSLLCRSYEQYFQYDPGRVAVLKKAWAEYDQEVYTNLDTVGACGFITIDNRQPVGFASWDPRRYPIGIIGHNCVLPEFRGNAYGRRQIREVLRRLISEGFVKIRATTGEHEFFEPARRMYLACGFHALSPGDKDPKSDDEKLTYEIDIQTQNMEGW